MDGMAIKTSSKLQVVSTCVCVNGRGGACPRRSLVASNPVAWISAAQSGAAIPDCAKAYPGLYVHLAL
jgi:hypothetical protein